MQDFAQEGLRTLCLACTELDENEYEQWNVLFHKAATSINDREEKVAHTIFTQLTILQLEEAAELIEKNLILLGASAVEGMIFEISVAHIKR